MIIYDILLILQYRVSTTVMDLIVVFCVVSCLYLCLRCCVSVSLPFVTYRQTDRTTCIAIVRNLCYHCDVA